MRTWKRWVPVLVAGLLCGCFQIKDELVLQPDGSGTVRLTVRSSVPEELLSMLGGSSGFGGGGSIYPPINEGEAHRFFPSKDFTVKVEEQKGEDSKTVIIEAAFKNVKALLDSPYAKAHQLTLKLGKDGALALQGLSGAEAAARTAGMKPDNAMGGFAPPGLEDAQKKKGEMRFEFRVTLPNAVGAGNGNREGKTTTWVVERAKCKDDEEFAAKLATVLEAGCSGDGLKFTPVTPPRLGLLPFPQLAFGKAADATTALDTNKVAAAAKFVPYALHVTRSLDLSGEGSSRENQAQLLGAVVLPTEFAPQRWGEAKLTEAVDAKGKSLMPKEEGESFTSMRFGGFGMGNETDDAEQGDSAPKKDTGEQKHVVAFSFNAPDWKVKEIGRIKGSVQLQYLGGSEVLKLSNAVPASLVMDMSNRSSFSDITSDPERGQVSNPRLAELGMPLHVQMAMVQSGMTMLSLETGAGKAVLVDAQVFDAEGRPWPTTLMQSDSSGPGNRSCQVMVSGKPKPPFSLALLLSGVGASVEVPVLVEKVPVGGK